MYAFDVVSDHLLLDKLRLLGICSPLKDWIVDFLISRVIEVSVSGIRSSFMNIRSGVSQGSVLDQPFFLIFINNLHYLCYL